MTEIETIYKTYFNDVYLYVLSLCGNTHIAEDITSETFFKAIKSINRFNGNCELRVWLCQIAKNNYYSYLRKNKLIIQSDVPLELISDNDLGKSLLNSETSMQIHKTLHKLNEPYKEVFTLRVFGELSFKKIGKLFDKTENWACVTYHRAKNMIKERMEDY